MNCVTYRQTGEELGRREADKRAGKRTLPDGSGSPGGAGMCVNSCHPGCDHADPVCPLLSIGSRAHKCSVWSMFYCVCVKRSVCISHLILHGARQRPF